ncbi:MAG: hypothetical protein WC346_20135 [Methanogenium sp.]|jgi:hypothetical protein
MKKIQKETIKLKEIDLSKGDGHNHPDIVIGQLYLCKVWYTYEVGYFTRQWYGLNFSGIFPAGVQFDTPGTNNSHWEHIWKFTVKKSKKKKGKI